MLHCTANISLIISLGFQIHHTYSCKICCYIDLANFICWFYV